MRKFMIGSLKLILPLQIVACGSETPAFQEKPQALIKVSVNKAEDPEQMSGESFDIDSLTADEYVGSVGSADATVGGSESSITNPESIVGRGSSRDSSTAPGRSPTSGRSPTDESVPVPGQTSDLNPAPAPDAKTVAKACAPALRNLGKSMTVISVHESNSAISISPNSVIALKITGDRNKVVLDLDQETPLLGVCFFLAGHENELQFSTASSVKALAIVETGDQAKAQIVLTGGSSESLSVDLRGNHPTLSIQGVSAELCDIARPRSTRANFSCQP
jgi:hypothetical protein